MKMTKSTFWCDSVNVLWWVRGRSRNFKPFVANRVGEIQTSTDPKQLRYVPTSINPADMLSRGMHAVELAKCDTWWRGPAFLRQSEDTWPINKTFEKPTGDNELKRSVYEGNDSRPQEPKEDDEAYHILVALAECVAFPLVSNNYSSWLKLRRIQAWINRFVENCQKKRLDRISSELMVDELKKA